jgi:hypothetical protein
VQIRRAIDADWPAIWPFFSQIVEAGDTYAHGLVGLHVMHRSL